MVAKMSNEIVIGNERASTAEEIIPLLMRYLAGTCDGARRSDGIGFNKLDYSLGHELAAKPPFMWNEYDLFKARRILSRYSNTQIKEFWHAVPVVPDPFKKRQEGAGGPPQLKPILSPITEGAGAQGVSQSVGEVLVRRLQLREHDGKKWAEIVLAYGQPGFFEIKDAVKAIPGRRYLPEDKSWVVPYTVDALDALIHLIDEYEFDVPDDVDLEMRAVVGNYSDRIALSHASHHSLEIPGLVGNPFPFQQAGIAYARDTKKCLIADEMGLGKTIQAIATAQLVSGFPLLIVVPASLKPNWRREFHKWLPDTIGDGQIAVISGNYSADMANQIRSLRHVHERIRELETLADIQEFEDEISPHGQLPLLGSGLLSAINTLRTARSNLSSAMGGNSALASGKCRIAIINYDILDSWQKFFVEEWKPVMLVADEAHRLKNPKSKRSMAFRALSNKTERVLLLSGTPVVNQPMELWTVLQILQYTEHFGSFKQYRDYYCDTWDWEQHLERLQALNKKCRSLFMVRRLKSDVLKELPDKLVSTIPLEIDNRAEYEAAESDISGYFGRRKAEDEAFQAGIAREADLLGLSGEDKQKYIEKETRAKITATEKMAAINEALLRWEALKQVAVKGKMQKVKDWIDEFLESGEKLVVFATHKHVVKQLSEWYDAPFITGETPVETRMLHVDRFQTDESCKVIVGNLQAMGEGLTLTAASNVAFVQFGWNPKDQQQAEDRCHRIGQKDTVNVWNLVASGTIEDDLVALIEKKREVTTAIHDGEKEAEQVKIFEELRKRVEERKRRK